MEGRKEREEGRGRRMMEGRKEVIDGRKESTYRWKTEKKGGKGEKGR